MNADLTILTAFKGNVPVIINTLDYNWNIGAFLEQPAWRMLAKDSTEMVENRTTLKKLALAAEVSFRLLINHQSPLYNILNSKNHKMRWNACGSFLECNNWNPKQLMQSEDIRVLWRKKTPKNFTIKYFNPPPRWPDASLVEIGKSPERRGTKPTRFGGKCTLLAARGARCVWGSYRADIHGFYESRLPPRSRRELCSSGILHNVQL